MYLPIPSGGEYPNYLFIPQSICEVDSIIKSSPNNESAVEKIYLTDNLNMNRNKFEAFIINNYFPSFKGVSEEKYIPIFLAKIRLVKYPNFDTSHIYENSGLELSENSKKVRRNSWWADIKIVRLLPEN
jgi:hypothetical protein